MPRIAHESIKKHREARKSEILTAAYTVLKDEGFDAVSFSSVAKRVGIARNSIYDYYESNNALITAMLMNLGPQFASFLSNRLQDAATVDEMISTFVRSMFEWNRDSNFELVIAANRSKIDAVTLTRMREIYREPLDKRLADAGVAGFEDAIVLVHSLITTIGPTLAGNWDEEHVDQVAKFAGAGFAALASEY